MAQIILEPAQTNPATADWQAALAKIAKAAKGLDNLNCTLQSGVPVIRIGSSFELNGVVYECLSDETILLWDTVPMNTKGYVIAVPDTDSQTCHFEFSITNPGNLDYSRGGYYNGTSRYFYQFYKRTSMETIGLQNMDKVIKSVEITKTDPENPTPGQIWLRMPS
jgi:hypothetical protein